MLVYRSGRLLQGGKVPLKTVRIKFGNVIERLSSDFTQEDAGFLMSGSGIPQSAAYVVYFSFGNHSDTITADSRNADEIKRHTVKP